LNRYTPSATTASLALLAGIQNANPVINKNIAIIGNVHNNKDLLPKRSIARTAGRAKRKLRAPKPREAMKA
jgi:hypothetical protein